MSAIQPNSTKIAVETCSSIRDLMEEPRVVEGFRILGDSCAVISGAISRITIAITHIGGLITLLITTHEPPSICVDIKCKSLGECRVNLCIQGHARRSKNTHASRMPNVSGSPTVQKWPGCIGLKLGV